MHNHPVSRNTAIVVSDGPVGSTIAFRLAQAGLTVTLVESAWSRSCLEPLAPQLAHDRPGSTFEPSLRSAGMYPAFASELQTLSERDPGYRQCGGLEIALDEDE